MPTTRRNEGGRYLEGVDGHGGQADGDQREEDEHLHLLKMADCFSEEEKEDVRPKEKGHRMAMLSATKSRGHRFVG